MSGFTPPAFGDPLTDSWFPWIVALIVGVVVCLRTYMQGMECPCSERLEGKRVIITGASSGIGKETARELAKRGATVVLACRDIGAAKTAAAEICTTLPNANLHPMQIDLCSFQSVRGFASDVLSKFGEIDILINNAGIMLCPLEKTVDGHERHLQTNYLGHFLLTHLLLDRLKSNQNGARIINVTALAHFPAKFYWDDLNLENNYLGREAYGQSKLALTSFTRYMGLNVLKNTKVTINCVHPGIVRNTKLTRYTPLETPFISWFTFPVTWLLLKTPTAGSQTIIYMCVALELAETSGQYFSECQIKEPSDLAKDENAAKRLYNHSLTLVGLAAGGDSSPTSENDDEKSVDAKKTE